MDPLLPLGVLSGCLSAYAGIETTWVKRQTDEDQPTLDQSRPICPSLQPMRMKYLSNLRKDFEENIVRLGTEEHWRPDESTWWDEQFHLISLASAEKGEMIDSKHMVPVHGHNNDLSIVKAKFNDLKKGLNNPNTSFKIKLPDDFEPLKSKFFGDNFHIGSFPQSNNPFMSPVFADDQLMSKLPHVDIVVSGKII